jgi:hypothetical protein
VGKPSQVPDRIARLRARWSAFDGKADPVAYAFETLDGVAQGTRRRVRAVST